MTDDSLLDQLAEEFTQRVREGKPPDVEEFANRYPQLAGRIRELFPTLMLLEGLAAGSPATAELRPSPLSAGSVFGNYRIEREIGRGGMGIVYEAVHVLLEKRVALKVLPVRTLAGPEHLERFFREARTAAGLHHTNIVPVFDVGQVDGTPYFAMQYIEGRSLDRILRTMQSAEREVFYNDFTSDRISGRTSDMPASLSLESSSPKSKETRSAQTSSGRLGRIRAGLPVRPDDYFRWVAGIGIQAAEGLAYAHERKIIHRDIKPSNLLLDNEGVLWIADFGLARKIEDPAITQSGTLIGTPRYMSPEQAEAAKRPVDQRSDIYSLGTTLYELLTCRPVFEGNTPQEVLTQIINREPVAPRQLNVEIPADLATVVMKAMTKRPEDRYQSARELAEDLQRWQKMEPIKARPIGPLGRTIRWCRRNPRVAAITATAAAIIIALTGIYVANLTMKNREIRTALNRAELGIRRAELDTAALQAALLDDTEEYIGRAAEVSRIDHTTLSDQKTKSFPYAVNHLILIDPWNKNLSPEIEQGLIESEERALEMARRAVDLHEARFAESIQLLGEYFYDKKKLDRAEWLYRQTLALVKPIAQYRRLETRATKKLAALLEKKAESAMDSREAGKAAALYRELLQLRREISPQDELGNVLLERNLGLALTDSGQFEEAEKVLLRSYRSCLGKLEKDNPSTQMAARSLVSLYAAWKKQPERIAEYGAVLPNPKIISMRELGRQSFTDSGEGPFSAAWGGKQVWAFGHVPAGAGFPSSSWLWNDAGQKGDKLGPQQQRKDDRGRSLSLLPLTADEEKFNSARSDPGCHENCQEYWSIRPGPVIPLPGNGGALLFYSKDFIRPGDMFKNWSSLGTSIALWKDPTAPAVRRDLRPGTAEPSLLFQKPEPAIGYEAFAWNNYLYAYGRTPAQGGRLIVARVPLEQALQRSAWRFYAGDSRWSEAWQEAVPVMDGYRGSVSWNWYLGKFARFWDRFDADTLCLSTADRPEGPWSQIQEIPLGQKPGTRINCAMAHPELSVERGRVQYLTYQLETGLFRSETRLVELVFK
jgi:serine/threonine protein kinase